MTFQGLNGLAPPYLSGLVTRYIPRRLRNCGFRSFPAASPQLCNDMPLEIKSCESFQEKLKDLSVQESLFNKLVLLCFSRLIEKDKEGINATYQIAYLSTLLISPNPSLHAQNLDNLHCISNTQKRIALHTQLILRNRSLSVYGVLNYALIRSHNPVYCATGVVALTFFLFRA